jgi:hypothetical protein
MKTLKESLLSDIESNLSLGDDEVAKMHILGELHNKDKYYYDRRSNNDDKYFNIFKHHNKWIVDVNGFITCYCPDGYVTDGSFEFGSIQRDFMICAVDDGDPCNCTSLRYGPKIVYGGYTIDACKELKDLKYCPTQVVDEVLVRDTGITTLKYFPKSCYAAKIVNNKNLKSLKGAKHCSVKRQILIVGNGIDTTKDMLMNMSWKVTDIISVNASREYVSDDSELGTIFKLPF